MDSLHVLCVIGILAVTVRLEASSCNGNGMRNPDGTCDCDQDFYGKDCECSSMYGLPAEACMRPGSSILCSRRGECVCGMCSCFSRRTHSAERYSGQYCECDDYSCNYHNNLICGGNGRCECGQCNCNEGYSGDACEYTDSVESCIPPNSDKICNGHGLCVNGVCQCQSDSLYKGRYCKDCPTCPGQCELSYPCALCYTENNNNCTEVCGPMSVNIVDTIDDIENQNDDERLCQHRSPSDTQIYFTYAIDKERNLRLRVLRDQTHKKDGSDDDTSSTSCLTYSASFLTLLVAAVILC